jgi:hypothetical protein
VGVDKLDRLLTLEVKTERKHTGNLFIETWSNKTPDAEWRRDGWILTLSTDLIAFAFLDVEAFYLIDFRALRDWCLDGAMYLYPERSPAASLEGRQKNHTIGHIVPVREVAKALPVTGYKRAAGGGWEHQRVEVK